MIPREIEKELLRLAKGYPVITLTGPRQSGKTTLARKVFPNKKYISLEDLDTRELAKEDPRSFLKEFPQGGIFDEIQHVPEILSYIQTDVDKTKIMGRYIWTGSAQLELLENISQSLAGRTALLKLMPFSFEELKKISPLEEADSLLLYGFFPAIHDRHLNPTKAYRNYVETYLERDVRKLRNIQNLSLFKKFLHLCAGRIGQLLNRENLSNEVGVSQPTIQSWLSVLEASYILFFLEPYHENFNKRITKAPKLYFFDPGLAAYLLSIEDTQQIAKHPLRGALFENMVIMEFFKHRFNQGKDPNLFFFRDNHGTEVDLLFHYGHLLFPVEIKSASTYHEDFTRNIRQFKKIAGKRIERAMLVYNGNTEQTLDYIELTNFKNVRTRMGLLS